MAILRRLAVSPALRYDLHSELGIPQSTLGRILGDFQERAWIHRDSDVYELTPLGSMLADELSSMVETVEMIHRLKDIVEFLPITELDFDRQVWKGATVTTASADGLATVVQRIIEKTQMADTLRVITNAGYISSLTDHRNAVVDGNQELMVVFARPILDSILADPDRARLLGEILESGRADIYSFDGTFPYVMGIRDGGYVGIAAVDERGIPLGFVQFDDQAVWAWVSDTIEYYRQRATPVTASMVARSLKHTTA